MKSDKSTSFQQSTLLPWIELRVANQSNACYDAHSHDEFSFGIIDSGSADYHNQTKIHRINKGDVVTTNPADVHSCNPQLGTDGATPWSYRMLFVDTVKMSQYQQEVLAKQDFDYSPFNANLERSAKVAAQFSTLFNSLQNSDSTLAAEHAFFDFVSMCFSKTPITDPTIIRPNLAIVREMLLDEVEANHQLENLAEQAGVSRYQLLRAFKNQYGLSPHAYLMDEKIKRAKQMLKQGKAISDVALTLGFADQAHFQRQFRRKLSVTPKFYQSHFVR